MLVTLNQDKAGRMPYFLLNRDQNLSQGESHLTQNTSMINPLDPTYLMALTAVYAAEERKGSNILLLNVAEVSSLADYFLLVTGFSSTQVRAIARAIEDKMIEAWQISPKRVEGLQMGSWVLMDFADIIVHIMMEDERGFYNLEAFWGEAHRVDLPTVISEPVLNKPYTLQTQVPEDLNPNPTLDVEAPIWDLVTEASSSVLDDEWQDLPADLARNFDDYQNERPGVA